MRRQPPAERGMALIIVVALIALGATWITLSQLNAASGSMPAANRAHNALVLNRAKQALIGYAAAQAAKAGEENPGALPCPEAAGYFDNPAQEGQTASSCALPKVGRFPWRTIGTEKLVDSAGEPLWYVVSPGWAYSGSRPVINSDTSGQLTVDGVANDAVALIIAPGAALNVPAATGCAARQQRRPKTGTPDWRDYLECENATSPADSVFVTSGPSGSFNDQVVKITAAELLPGVEAAIANRVEREIVPALKTVYAPPDWGLTGSNPLYPFAAPFANPGPGAGTSSFQGAAGTYQGLLPMNQTQGCTASAAEPRCLPALVAWSSSTPPDVVQIGGYGSFQSKNCFWQTPDLAECSGEYRKDGSNPSGPGMIIQMSATLANVAMGLRKLDAAKATIEADNDAAPFNPQQVTVTVSSTMNGNGSATVRFSGTLPNLEAMGWGSHGSYRVRLARSVIGDHALLDPADGTTGWFVRNGWYRLAHYAVASGHTSAVLPSMPSCTTGASCLSIANVFPAGAQRAILILAGRSLNGSVRPSATLANYLEFGNATLAYERQPVSAAIDAALKRPFNDRVVVLGANP